MKHELAYSEVCNFLRHFLAELPAFLSSICLAFLFIRILSKVNNEHTESYLKTDRTLLKVTI